MYRELIFLHGVVRWLVLVLLGCSVYVSVLGVQSKRPFSKGINSLRHWTATTAHIQLVIGILLYIKSPAVKVNAGDGFFFGVVHLVMMLAAIVLLTIGSGLARRRSTDLQKYRTMLIFFGVALLVILIAIPWPFSPFAQRSLLRMY